jgi:hypothetical protein
MAHLSLTRFMLPPAAVVVLGSGKVRRLRPVSLVIRRGRDE